MIRLHRAASPPRVLLDKGLARRQAHCDLYDRSEPHRDGQESFDIDESIYNDLSVRQALDTAQRGKCCYCESAQQPFEVEHYRPKNAVRQSRGDVVHKPGYYWLAYAWENLLSACVLCNQARKDVSGAPTGKGILFPLADPARRARSHHDSLAGEGPLLLNPYEEDPETHIAYRQYMPHGRTDKGKASIDVLQLRGASQLARPRTLWERVNKIREMISSPDLSPEFVQEFIEELWTYADSGSEFSAMVRAALHEWGLLPP